MSDCVLVLSKLLPIKYDYIVHFWKISQCILSSDRSLDTREMIKWETKWKATKEKALLIHAGSGRQLDECIDFCERTGSVFIELSTGLKTEQLDPQFYTYRLSEYVHSCFEDPKLYEVG